MDTSVVAGALELERLGEALLGVSAVVVAGGLGGVGVPPTLTYVVEIPWYTVVVDVFSQPQELSQTIAWQAEFALQVSCSSATQCASCYRALLKPVS